MNVRDMSQFDISVNHPWSPVLYAYIIAKFIIHLFESSCGMRYAIDLGGATELGFKASGTAGQVRGSSEDLKAAKILGAAC